MKSWKRKFSGGTKGKGGLGKTILLLALSLPTEKAKLDFRGK
jgi:hypothetical protein